MEFNSDEKISLARNELCADTRSPSSPEDMEIADMQDMLLDPTSPDIGVEKYTDPGSASGDGSSTAFDVAAPFGRVIYRRVVRILSEKVGLKRAIVAFAVKAKLMVTIEHSLVKVEGQEPRAGHLLEIFGTLAQVHQGTKQVRALLEEAKIEAVFSDSCENAYGTEPAAVIRPTKDGLRRQNTSGIDWRSEQMSDSALGASIVELSRRKKSRGVVSFVNMLATASPKIIPVVGGVAQDMYVRSMATVKISLNHGAVRDLMVDEASSVVTLYEWIAAKNTLKYPVFAAYAKNGNDTCTILRKLSELKTGMEVFAFDCVGIVAHDEFVHKFMPIMDNDSADQGESDSGSNAVDKEVILARISAEKEIKLAEIEKSAEKEIKLAEIEKSAEKEIKLAEKEIKLAEIEKEKEIKLAFLKSDIPPETKGVLFEKLFLKKDESAEERD